jgi:hypothetical protein
MLPELKMKLDSAEAEHTDFWGTPVLSHHSAYTLLFSVNLYPYVYRIIYYIDINVQGNMKVTTIYNGPTNALVCIKTLIQMSHTKTFKITPTCFDHQTIIIRELSDPG